MLPMVNPVPPAWERKEEASLQPYLYLRWPTRTRSQSDLLGYLTIRLERRIYFLPFATDLYLNGH